jgi:hypothetical protein
MDNYDNQDQPYSPRWWVDFVWIGIICGVVLLGAVLPKLFG